MLRSSMDQALITNNRTKQRYETMMQSSTPHGNDGMIEPASPMLFKPKIDQIKLGLHSISQSQQPSNLISPHRQQAAGVGRQQHQLGERSSGNMKIIMMN